jgi:SAM-dependent methyltransferase
VRFADDIAAVAKDAGTSSGLYIGCGNGRNYIPLTEAGLDLIGLDISATAISQLAGRLPERRDRLVTGDLSALPAGQRFPLVVAIQVMQHGAHVSGERSLAAAAGGTGAMPRRSTSWRRTTTAAPAPASGVGPRDLNRTRPGSVAQSDTYPKLGADAGR